MLGYVFRAVAFNPKFIVKLFYSSSQFFLYKNLFQDYNSHASSSYHEIANDFCYPEAIWWHSRQLRSQWP